MASGKMRDITPGIVFGLSHDKAEQVGFDSAMWARFQEERPQMARFLATRLREAFPENAEEQSRALSVIMEFSSLEERVSFADTMREELGASLPYLGGLALSTDHLNPEILPLADLGGFDAEAA